jgi:ABC-type antimicrobial peptide transport system permease subunit
LGPKNVVNDAHKTECSKIGLIIAGILMAFMCLTGIILSIYLFVIINKTTTTTTTTGKYKLVFDCSR